MNARSHLGTSGNIRSVAGIRHYSPEPRSVPSDVLATQVATNLATIHPVTETLQIFLLYETVLNAIRWFTPKKYKANLPGNRSRYGCVHVERVQQRASPGYREPTTSYCMNHCAYSTGISSTLGKLRASGTSSESFKGHEHAVQGSVKWYWKTQ